MQYGDSLPKSPESILNSTVINQGQFTQTTVLKCFHHITSSQVSKLWTRWPQWQQKESKDEHEDLCSDVSLQNVQVNIWPRDAAQPRAERWQPPVDTNNTAD